eukprot:6879129-Prymnesium_polylepis.1
MAARPTGGWSRREDLHTASKRSEATKSNQDLFLGQIPGISPGYGDATSLSGTTPAKQNGAATLPLHFHM